MGKFQLGQRDLRLLPCAPTMKQDFLKESLFYCLCFILLDFYYAIIKYYYYLLYYYI